MKFYQFLRIYFINPMRNLTHSTRILFPKISLMLHRIDVAMDMPREKETRKGKKKRKRKK
jgi:hypothetical protein